MQTISELLTAIQRLPEEDRAQTVDELDRILDLREGPREVALGLLALDLVTFETTTSS